jgi:acetyl-CoA synthetase
MRHPAVAEAAVKPEPTIGELKAFVVLKNGREATDEMRMDILGFARKEMVPRRLKEIEFVESIPKTRSGKILRRLLKARELGLPEGDISTLRSPKIK